MTDTAESPPEWLGYALAKKWGLDCWYCGERIDGRSPGWARVCEACEEELE